jgi:predicted transcriptional regulator
MTRLRRSRMDIVVDVLTVALDGVLKTRIMYEANLSYKLLQRYLALLQKENLIEAVRREGVTIYVTTEKGRSLLQKSGRHSVKAFNFKKALYHIAGSRNAEKV